MPTDLIADGNATVRVPEGKFIQKDPGIIARVLLYPACTRICGLIDPRVVSESYAEEISRRGAKRFYIPEVKRISAGNLRGQPSVTAVSRPSKRTVVSARPGNCATDSAHASKSFSGAALLLKPLRGK